MTEIYKISKGYGFRNSGLLKSTIIYLIVFFLLLRISFGEIRLSPLVIIVGSLLAILPTVQFILLDKDRLSRIEINENDEILIEYFHLFKVKKLSFRKENLTFFAVEIIPCLKRTNRLSILLNFEGKEFRLSQLESKEMGKKEMELLKKNLEHFLS